MGLRAVEYRDGPALVRGRLNWVQHNDIRAETLTCAHARLVDSQGTLSLAQAWGSGSPLTADARAILLLMGARPPHHLPVMQLVVGTQGHDADIAQPPKPLDLR